MSDPKDLSSAYRTCEFSQPLKIKELDANLYNEFKK